MATKAKATTQPVILDNDAPATRLGGESVGIQTLHFSQCYSLSDFNLIRAGEGLKKELIENGQPNAPQRDLIRSIAQFWQVNALPIIRPVGGELDEVIKDDINEVYQALCTAKQNGIKTWNFSGILEKPHQLPIDTAIAEFKHWYIDNYNVQFVTVSGNNRIAGSPFALALKNHCPMLSDGFDGNITVNIKHYDYTTETGRKAALLDNFTENTKSDDGRQKLDWNQIYLAGYEAVKNYGFTQAQLRNELFNPHQGQCVAALLDLNTQYPLLNIIGNIKAGVFCKVTYNAAIMRRFKQQKAKAAQVKQYMLDGIDPEKSQTTVTKSLTKEQLTVLQSKNQFFNILFNMVQEGKLNELIAISNQFEDDLNDMASRLVEDIPADA